jgi:FkbM family methyltransferase
MSVLETESAFRAGKLDKAAFIEAMFQNHKTLFQYADHIEESNIRSLTIEAGRVILELKNPPIRLQVPAEDMRAAPVEALNFGDYEAEEFAALTDLVRDHGEAPACLVDIGGNVGFYSIGLKACFPNLLIHAYEPIPATAEQFAANCRLNHTPDIHLHRYGLSDEAGEATFYVHPRLCVAASQRNILEDAESVPLKCALKRLDDEAALIAQPIDFIKCDIEGAEFFAFKGAQKVLAEHQPAIFSEMLRKWSAQFDYHPNDLIAFLARFGYRCFALHDGIAPLDQIDDETVATNFIFLHQTRHLTSIQRITAANES